MLYPYRAAPDTALQVRSAPDRLTLVMASDGGAGEPGHIGATPGAATGTAAGRAFVKLA